MGWVITLQGGPLDGMGPMEVEGVTVKIPRKVDLFGPIYICTYDARTGKFLSEE